MLRLYLCFRMVVLEGITELFVLNSSFVVSVLCCNHIRLDGYWYLHTRELHFVICWIIKVYVLCIIVRHAVEKVCGFIY